MTRKKIKFAYDAPVTLTFSLVCIVIYLIDTFILKDYLVHNILISPTAAGGVFPFSFSDPLSYLRLILYIFGSSSITLLLSELVLILLLGPSIEEYYGSVVIGIMAVISVLFSGVINTCFCDRSINSPAVIVFMMIFLNGFIAIAKKRLTLSFIVVFLMFTVFYWIENKQPDIISGFVTVLINIAGGLCGSLIACLASPKARAEKRYNDKSENTVDVYMQKKKKEKKGWRVKASSKKETSDKNGDETIIAALDSEETIVGPLN